jgi:hypothetical protein
MIVKKNNANHHPKPKKGPIPRQKTTQRTGISSIDVLPSKSPLNHCLKLSNGKFFIFTDVLFKYTSASSKLFLKNLLLKTLNSFKTTFSSVFIGRSKSLSATFETKVTFLLRLIKKLDLSLAIIFVNTSVNIKNFPLDSFKQWFNGDLEGKTSIELLTKSKVKQGLKRDPRLLYAIKEKVDDSIICKTRDGSISRINIEGTLVNFLLPFRDKDTKKIYNDSKEE